MALRHASSKVLFVHAQPTTPGSTSIQEQITHGCCIGGADFQVCEGYQ
jgi:hypothetical protein